MANNNKNKRTRIDRSIDSDVLLEDFDELTGTIEDIYRDTSARFADQDLDDYEYQQEQAHGVQSQNLQSIPTDRYFKRTRKSR